MYTKSPRKGSGFIKKSYVMYIVIILTLTLSFIIGFQADMDWLMYGSVILAIISLFINFFITQEKNEKYLKELSEKYEEEHPNEAEFEETSQFSLIKIRTQEFMMGLYGFLYTDTRKDILSKSLFAVVLTFGLGSQLFRLVLHGGLGGKILGFLLLYWAYQLAVFLLFGIHLADIMVTPSSGDKKEKTEEDDSCPRCGRYAARTYCDSCDRKMQPHLYKYKNQYKN